MRRFKVGLCFIDEDGGEVIAIQPLRSNWSIDTETAESEEDRMRVRTEIASVLSDQIRMEMNPDVLKGMLKKME